MGVINYLRKQRFDSKLIKFAKFFHLHNFVRKIYYKVILLLNDKMKIALFGYNAQFYARKIDEISLVENFLVDEREGEIRVIQNILEELKTGDIAYDVGASIGTHAIFMALKVGSQGKVFAFEPEDRSFRELEANIALNKLNNIIPLKVALSDCQGEGVIRGGLGSFTLMNESNFIPPVEKVEKVQIVSADSFIQENNLPLPNVIKIDVEGYEYNVIKGLERVFRNKDCRMVACEIHPTLVPKDVTVDNIINFIISCGFDKPRIYPRGLTLHTFFIKTNTR